MFRKRLVLTATLIFALGITCGIVFDLSDTFSLRAVFLVVSIISIVAVAVFHRYNDGVLFKRLTAAAFAVAAFSLGVVRVNLYDESAKSFSSFDGKSDTALFEISEINEGYIEAVVVTSEIGVPDNERVRLFLDNTPDHILVGDYITVDLEYKYKDSSAYYSNNIALAATGRMTDYQEGNGLFYNIRKSVSENSEILYSSFESAPAISKAVTIGDRSDMNSYLFTVYKTAGISHILAISGLHITIITLSFHKLLLLLRAGRNIASIVSTALSFAYTALVGFTPGAVRSSVMIGILMIFSLFLYESDGLTTISLALLALILFNPYSLFSSGLQLSFLSCLGIMLSEPIIESVDMFFSSRKRHSKGIRQFLFKNLPLIITPAITSFSASVFSFPVLCLSFDTISYVSPLVNLFAVPMFTYAVELALISFLLAPISKYVALIFAYPAGFLIQAVTEVSEFLHRIDVAVISVHIEYMIVPVILSFIIIFSLILFDRWRNLVVGISSFGFCLSIAFCGILNNVTNDNTAIIEYGNDGSEYVYFSANDNGIYVDLGGYTSNPDAVFENGYISLGDYVVLTYNSYSLERFEYFTSNVNVSRVHLPNPKTADDMSYIEEIKELANERNCDIMYFDDYIGISPMSNSLLELFGGTDDINTEPLICIDIGGKKFRFFGHGFDNAVNCDAAVLMDGYISDISKVNSSMIFADYDQMTENADSMMAYKGFDERLRFEFDYSESDFVYYEP